MKSIQPALIIVLLASGTNHALAHEMATGHNSGVIQFQGALVEASCAMDFQRNQIVTSCFRQGKNQVVASPVSAIQHLPQGTGRSELRWLDSSHKRGILTQNYN